MILKIPILFIIYRFCSLKETFICDWWTGIYHLLDWFYIIPFGSTPWLRHFKIYHKIMSSWMTQMISEISFVWPWTRSIQMLRSSSGLYSIVVMYGTGGMIELKYLARFYTDGMDRKRFREKNSDAISFTNKISGTTFTMVFRPQRICRERSSADKSVRLFLIGSWVTSAICAPLSNRTIVLRYTAYYNFQWLLRLWNICGLYSLGYLWYIYRTTSSALCYSPYKVWLEEEDLCSNAKPDELALRLDLEFRPIWLWLVHCPGMCNWMWHQINKITTIRKTQRKIYFLLNAAKARCLVYGYKWSRKITKDVLPLFLLG